MTSLWVSVLIGCNKTSPQVMHISTDYERLCRATFKGTFKHYNSDEFLADPESEDFYDYIPDSFENDQKAYYSVPSNGCCKQETILILGSAANPIRDIDVIELIEDIESNRG